MKIDLTQTETAFNIGDRVVLSKPVFHYIAKEIEGEIIKIYLRPERVGPTPTDEFGEKVLCISPNPIYQVFPHPKHNHSMSLEVEEKYLRLFTSD